MIAGMNNIIAFSSWGLFTGLPEVSTVDTIEEAMYSLMAIDVDIAALVDTRIYPNKIPQKASMPAITYQHISGNREHGVDGVLGLVQSRFQINCWAATYAEAKGLSEAVRSCLDGYSGTVSSVVIRSIMLEDENDFPEFVPEEDVLNRYGKRMDFMVWYNE